MNKTLCIVSTFFLTATLALGGCAPPPNESEGSNPLSPPPVTFINTWHGWESLSGVVTSDPAVAASASRLDVFAAIGGSVYHRAWTGSAWSPANGYWDALGNAGHAVEQPAAVNLDGRVELFARDTVTGHLVHRELVSAWSGWEDLGGSLASEKPNVVVEKTTSGTTSVDRVLVFTRNSDNTLALLSGTGQSHWATWRNLGGGILSAPAAVSWAPNRVDVFVRGVDNRLYHNFTDTWRDWAPGSYEYLGGSVGASPAATSWGANRLDVFATATNGAVNHLAWTGNAWTAWESVAGGAAYQANNTSASPVAVQRGSGVIDVFVQGGDRALYRTG